MEKQDGTIVINSMKMAGWLMFNQHYLVDIKRDLKDGRKKIFIFKESERIRENLRRYKDYKHIAPNKYDVK